MNKIYADNFFGTQMKLIKGSILVYGIYTIKCGTGLPVKFHLSLSFLNWIKNEMNFYPISEQVAYKTNKLLL